MISTFTAVFDANVLVSARLRSLLMELAMTGLFRARWSADIHREWIGAVCKLRPDLTPDMLAKTRADMDAAVPDGCVTGYEALIAGLDLPDTNDRHVLAAAIRCGASVIVTFNERHFPAERLTPFGLHTRHPDLFIRDVDEIEPGGPGPLAEAAAADLAHYVNPPLSVDDYISGLRLAGVPMTASYLEQVKVLLRS